jgi:hypothetical protein
MAEWIRQPICVESDCLNLIRAIEKKVVRSGWEGILLEIQVVCNLLPDYNVRHIRREANQVAHGLAQEDIRQRQCAVMRFRTPPCVQELVENEAQGGL